MGSRKQKRVLAREYSYDSYDLSVAVYRVVVRIYGENSLMGLNAWGFLSIPMVFLAVDVGPTEKARGIQGQFRLKHVLLRGIFNVAENSVSCYVKEKFQGEAERFLNEIEKELDINSIYRGKAITINREFLNLTGVSTEGIVFPSRTETLLRSQLWSIIEEPEACAAMSVYPQRKILFHGPFGSGKTLAALLTAKKGVEHKWTVIYMPPAEGLSQRSGLGLAIARKYQPAIFLMEDIDHEQRRDDPYGFRQVLADIDGLTSKGAKVIIVMTTNFKDKIAASILRPGRIDQMIEFELLMRDEIRDLIKKQIPPDRLSDDIDWDEVFSFSSTYPPAFLKGMATNAALRAVGEGKDRVTQDMLIEAAKDLRFQFEACEKAISTGQYL